jgi:hypothetical protein
MESEKEVDCPPLADNLRDLLQQKKQARAQLNLAEGKVSEAKAALASLNADLVATGSTHPFVVAEVLCW